MRGVLLAAVAIAAPLHAQSMADMPGMAMPVAAAPSVSPAPLPPADFYADRDYPAAAMDAARAQMMREEGGQRFGQLFFNLAEVQAHQGRDGYRWDGEAWFGGDIDRAMVRTEGSGAFREGAEEAEVQAHQGRDGYRWDGEAWFGGDIDRAMVRTEGSGPIDGGAEEAEVQALYSHAIGPYVDLQGGIRQDFDPVPRRTYATIGIEGLAPYRIETEARLFVSTQGELLGRIEGWYDERLTQRLVLQPRVELNLAAQTTRSRGVGRGLTDAELGLRLRYEISRRFAPYVGVSYDARTGSSADLARARGNDPTVTSLVGGVRFWL